MSDVKIWIAASMEIAELQGSISSGSRPKRRKITNLLWLPNGSKQWVCDSCYFDAHGGG
jgi:hypothetical protein